MSKIRVLILADDCNPEWPSLPVVGYKAAKAIAEYADVTVATSVRNRENIQKVGFGNAKVVYIDNEYVASPLHSLGKLIRGGDAVGWTTSIAMNYPSYVAFEWEVWRRFGDELKTGQFDVMHRVTPMSPTLPSPIATWCKEYNVPFILGPLNGGLQWPKQFENLRIQEKEGMSRLRSVSKFLPYAQSTLENSTKILAAFSHTISDIPEQFHEKVINFPEVGFDPNVFHSPVREPNLGKLKFLFASRLVPYKQPKMVVDCFRWSKVLREHELIIVGEGPEEEEMKNMIQRHNARTDVTPVNNVTFMGKKTQTEVGDLMRTSDVFIFPSIRELGAGVIVEAMASGLCCVAADYGGPSDLLADGRGIKIGMNSYEFMLTDFITQLASYANPPYVDLSGGRQFLVDIANRGRDYVNKTLSWDAKAQKILDVYKSCL